jgi:hypothetical protein
MKIKKVMLAKAGNGYNKEYKASYNRYIVAVENDKGTYYIQDIFTPEELKNLSYWSPRSQVIAMTCWGTSQFFEAQLVLASFLGIGQKKGEDWGEYTNRIIKIITK